MPTNAHAAPAEENFRDKYGNPGKSLVVEDYTTHMGCVDKSDQMAPVMLCAEESGIGQRSSLFTSHVWSLSVF
jgi:hypothetical protein